MELVQHDDTKEIWYKIAKYNENECPSQEIELYKKMLNVFHVGDFYYFIFNCPTAKVEWTSNSVSKILGISSPADFTLEYILTHIHPEDLPYFLDFERQVTDFFNKLPTEKVLKYKVSYDYRIRREDGKYIRILQQAITIQTNADGAVLRVLDVHTDISHLKKENGSTLTFIGLDGEPSYHNVSRAPIISKSKGTILSRREKEILGHLVKGRNSGQIAKSLFISKLTVEKHRKNMLKKTNSQSTIELAIRSIQENWYLLVSLFIAV